MSTRSRTYINNICFRCQCKYLFQVWPLDISIFCALYAFAKVTTHVIFIIRFSSKFKMHTADLPTPPQNFGLRCCAICDFVNFSFLITATMLRVYTVCKTEIVSSKIQQRLFFPLCLLLRTGWWNVWFDTYTNNK